MNDTPDRTAPRWLGFLALLAACGSGASTPSPDAHPFCMPPDGGGCMELPDCDPLADPGQSGCVAGEKCTWVVVTDAPEPRGRLDCVPAGPVALGGACTRGPAGETTGVDDCVAGAICVDGTCQDVCDFSVAASEACAAGFSCHLAAGLYQNPGGQPLAGACAATCDPIAQNECGPGEGCYVVSRSTSTTTRCAPAGTLGHGELIAGPAYINACLPGHQPRRRDLNSFAMECGALCVPAAVTVGMNEASEGGVAPATCAARGAAASGDPMDGESCRYWHGREAFDDLSPLSNTLGWCFRHAAFQYDTNADGTPDAPYPRCTTVTTGDVLPPFTSPPHDDAVFFMCVPRPAP